MCNIGVGVGVGGRVQVRMLAPVGGRDAVGRKTKR